MGTAMTEALAYLRVSGKGQINGDGFPRQREAIRRYAKAHGIGIVGEYADQGVSGTAEHAGPIARIRCAPERS